jgi:cobalt/nickel transport system permease protein
MPQEGEARPVRHGLLDPYHQRVSPLHRASPTAKLVVAIVVVAGIVALPRSAWLAYGAAGLALLVLALVSRAPLGRLARRILVLEPFVVGVALLSLLQPGGLSIFLAAVTKSTLCISTMTLLVATTRFSDLLLSLVRLRVPRLLVTTLALMYRYLFVLLDEMATLERARRSRSFSHGRRAVWRSRAAVAGQLFVLTSERAERIYAAMCARGWRQ